MSDRTSMLFETGDYCIKLCETEAELTAAQALRHEVFVSDFRAVPRPDGLDKDAFDGEADHLVLLDKTQENRVIAASRLIRAGGRFGFYSATEFDLSPLMRSGRNLVELGRTCVSRDHRNGMALRLIWSGLAEYVLRRDIDLVFGVASFPGQDPNEIDLALSYLHSRHLAPKALRPVAHGKNAVRVAHQDNPDPIQALAQMPPLLRSYLRLGCQVGQDAYVDPDFNCIDVLVVLDRTKLDTKYRSLLTRGLAA